MTRTHVHVDHYCSPTASRISAEVYCPILCHSFTTMHTLMAASRNMVKKLISSYRIMQLSLLYIHDCTILYTVISCTCVKQMHLFIRQLSPKSTLSLIVSEYHCISVFPHLRLPCREEHSNRSALELGVAAWLLCLKIHPSSKQDSQCHCVY